MLKKIIYFLLIINIKTFAQQAILPLSVNEFEQKFLKSTDAQLVDIRSATEFNRGHLKKAQNVDFNDDNFEKMVQTKLDKNKPVFIYCFSGGRSKNATTLLQEIGFKQVYEMKGGFAKWTASSKPYITTFATTEPIAAYTTENVTQIIKSNETVLVNFHANWSEPSKKMLPILNKLVDEKKMIKLLRLDADTNDSIAHSFQVDEIPTYIIYKNGKQIWRSTGEIPEEEFRDIMLKLKL